MWPTRSVYVTHNKLVKKVLPLLLGVSLSVTVVIRRILPHSMNVSVLVDASALGEVSRLVVFAELNPIHAYVTHWLQVLDMVSKLDFKYLVPGHGSVVSDTRAIAQTRDYLQWLLTRLTKAADQGMTMAEVLQPQAPPSITALADFQDEYQRSIVLCIRRLKRKR